MCGRTAMNFAEDELRAELARANVLVNQILNQPVWRQAFNIAPTYNQPVIRQIGDRGDQAGTRSQSDAEPPVSPRTSSFGRPGDLIIQTMRWGLIPFWTKRAPDYASIARTINCRDDSLLENRGMWNSIKGRKRCVVPVMGYYEWLKKSPKEKVPYFTKRADGKAMLLAGLWDSVQYEGSDERIYTYTIITTSAARSVAFLHDRMPVILEPGSDEMKKWLDPNEGWSMELANILKPYEGELLCYPVKKEVGKVGEDSPLFIVPLDSAENKSNIANFFSKTPSPVKAKPTKQATEEEAVDKKAGEDVITETLALDKRKFEEMSQQVGDEPSLQKRTVVDYDSESQQPVKTAQRKPVRRAPVPTKKGLVKKEGTSKITNFFAVQ